MAPHRIILETNEYRILEIPDEHADFDNLIGDIYNPRVNPDIDPEVLKQELKEFTELVNREGVYGYVLERWNPEIGVGWEQVDSCWGFVGQYSESDPKFNHYIVDELKGQIPKLKNKAGTK